MARKICSVIALAAGLAAIASAAAPARAGVAYIGDVIIPGNGADKSGLPSTFLQDGVSPQNALNGFGSGLAYAGGNLFDALPDRGPNQLNYSGGGAVDDTTSYDNRYEQFQINLTPVGSLQPNGTYASYNVSAINVAATLLKNSLGTQYVGLSSAFSTNPAIEGSRLDPEAIRVAPDGTTWISDEYGPYILHFNQQGQEIGSLALPAGFQIANPSATAANEAANNTTGRTSNRGMEGLAITPDGKTLVGIMQSSLTQDGGTNGINDRVLVYDLTNPTAAPKQYDYQLDSKNTPISELLAVNNHQFLVDERDSTGGTSGIKDLYEIDLNQASAPTNLATSPFSGTTATNGMPAAGTPTGITPLSKTLFANIGQILNAVSPSPFSNVDGQNGLPDKMEGYAWGPDLPDGRHLLLVTNDNDFAQQNISGYPNYIFAFAVDASSVPGFAAETFVPEPSAIALLALSSAALLRRRGRRC